MQELTKQTIQRLMKATGHVLHVKDFDDIERLDRLAQKVNGVSEDERRLLSSPFYLCGMAFYPLTVAKSIWLAEKRVEWGISGLERDSLFFFVLSIPNTEAALGKYSNFKKLDWEMKKFVRRLDCTADQIKLVCEKCCGVFDDEDERSDENAEGSTSSVYGGLIATLLREYGQTVSYWIHEAPIELVNELYDRLISRLVQEDDQNRAKSAANGKAIAPKVTTSMKMFKQFKDFEKVLLAKWSKTDGD